MTGHRILLCLLVLAFSTSCISLNYPEPEPERPARARADVRSRVADEALSWSDLTRAAREHRQRGEFAEARERLEQAANRVRDLPPSNAQRRTVFGMQARLASQLAEKGEIEAADDLTNELLAEAEAEPELGGASLVSLVLSVVDRRQQGEGEGGSRESQLPLLRIALDTAQTGAISRDRMNLAFRVAKEAYLEQDLALARRAIEQALSDALRLSPTKKTQLARLELLRARIAFDQDDLEVAESSATSANQLLTEADAEPSSLGMAEAALAEILAERGDTKRALVIARGAHARIGLEESIHDHARRVILASLARVERSAGDRFSARQHFEQAIAVPGASSAADAALVARLAIELQELDDPEAAAVAPPDVE